VIQVVWFKRDLRVEDHAPLAAAAARGPVLPLFIAEPSLWRAEDADPRHWTFARTSLEELRGRLAALGAPLVVRVGEVVPLLERLHRRHPVAGLWSHEETGNALTYARDRAVAAWCRAQGVPWTEIPQHGVFRRQRSREGWAKRWEARMAQPCTPIPGALRPVPGIDPGPLPTHADLGLGSDACQGQVGGSRAGQALFDEFLAGRGDVYHRSMSSPLTAERGCSRLSPHLAWGTLSLRAIAQVTVADLARPDAPRTARRAFLARLHWHCHFMQKLEDEPRIEHEDVVRGLAGLRPDVPDADRLAAWAAGRTGWPLVDACQRALHATGWITFRMRAMLTAVAAYDLWLPWRPVGLVLARAFTDYEPGIHWSQVQMQSGTTGINTLRMYNPTKQAQEQDPEGVFIRRWVPELAGVPTAWIHAPWTMPHDVQVAAGCRIGRDYPAPLVDHTTAVREARARIAAFRRDPTVQAEVRSVLVRHGSRKRQPERRPRRPVRVEPGQQTLFDPAPANLSPS
jgi:deoxyribodipyrimidine photo-lyase